MSQAAPPICVTGVTHDETSPPRAPGIGMEADRLGASEVPAWPGTPTLRDFGEAVRKAEV